MCVVTDEMYEMKMKSLMAVRAPQYRGLVYLFSFRWLLRSPAADSGERRVVRPTVTLELTVFNSNETDSRSKYSDSYPMRGSRTLFIWE
jgi:hypothetical protein